MDNTNLYDILGVSKNASFEEIKTKYKSLAQRHHPDKGGDPELFKQIKKAYEVLSDPVNREKYDTTGQYEHGISIRDESLDYLSRLFYNIVPNINAEVDDLVAIMKRECFADKQAINNNINTCNGNIYKTKKVIEKIKKRNNDGENILKMFAETQLKGYEKDLQTFMRQTKVMNTVIEILEDYQYGDVVSLLESFSNTSTANT